MINGTFFLLAVMPAITLLGMLGIGFASIKVIKSGRAQTTEHASAPSAPEARRTANG